MEPIYRIECIISGRVQMVMFRDFVRRAALRFGLVGIVQNQHDGTVLVTAEGSKKALLQLIAELHKGSMLARVDDVKIGWKEPQREFLRFTIDYAR